jgi:hypothetical protein
MCMEWRPVVPALGKEVRPDDPMLLWAILKQQRAQMQYQSSLKR